MKLHQRLLASMSFIAVMSCMPAWLAAEAVPTIDARYALHVARLKTTLPRGVFTILVQPPFVVIGDDPAERVKEHAHQTVAWAVRLLRQEYFQRDPSRILDIYLFKDKQSYEANLQRMFNETPPTPYGYYSPEHRALFMNIATGGGTLVHEIVHPYIHTNFPACPPWFNEGLASLYEQCGEREGRIVGYTNWRLEGLQEAIRARRTVPFQKLMALDSARFYADKGVHYAMSRYLCYYLQQRGLLRAYYRAFVKNHRADPTGFSTLRQVLGESDMNSFQSRWEDFCVSLSYP